MIHYFYFISPPYNKNILLLVAWDRNNLKRECFLKSYLFYRKLLEPWIKKICTCCPFHELFISVFLEIIHIALQCYYCNLGHFKQSWPIKLQENNNTFKEGWRRANQQFIKNNQLLKAQNLILIAKCFTRQYFLICMKLCIQHPGDIFLWQSCYFNCHLSHNFFTTIAMHCNNMRYCKSKIQLSFMFFASIHILQQTSQETHAFLQQVQKVTSLGCNWLILIHVVYFIS